MTTYCKDKRVVYKDYALTGRNVNHIHAPGYYPGLEDKRLSALKDSIYGLNEDIYRLDNGSYGLDDDIYRE
ncbi:hypothetical protein [Bacteroides gallinarum]|uniref:hypothetical protein n=1 Tax=Bacteroides gallinarum TaxID=376806 RepID=UPI000FE14565|nr:hypothetical protein [Bacteroides gallinarum]